MLSLLYVSDHVGLNTFVCLVC